MTEERLSDLAVLSIEEDVARNLNISDIIDEFSNVDKNRRIVLFHINYQLNHTYTYIIIIYRAKHMHVCYHCLRMHGPPICFSLDPPLQRQI